mgnify:FL=1
MGNQDQDTITRKPYSPPRLTVYGAVRDLTAGGSGKSSENNKGKAIPRPG